MNVITLQTGTAIVVSHIHVSLGLSLPGFDDKGFIQLVDDRDSNHMGLGQQACNKTGMRLSDSAIRSLERNTFHVNFK